MNRKNWPNIVTATRIALAPAVLTATMMGSKVWFVIFISTALFTDALDGFLARWLNAFSEFGRKLDSAADYLTMSTGLAGIAVLWPEVVRRELPWIVTALVSFFAVIVYGVVRLGRVPCYHTWLSKALAVGCAFSMVPLLCDWTALPFHVLCVLQVIGGIEELVIVMVVPWHAGEVPTLWHALRMRRESGQA